MSMTGTQVIFGKKFNKNFCLFLALIIPIKQSRLNQIFSGWMQPIWGNFFHCSVIHYLTNVWKRLNNNNSCCFYFAWFSLHHIEQRNVDHAARYLSVEKSSDRNSSSLSTSVIMLTAVCLPMEKRSFCPGFLSRFFSCTDTDLVSSSGCWAEDHFHGIFQMCSRCPVLQNDGNSFIFWRGLTSHFDNVYR